MATPILCHFCNREITGIYWAVVETATNRRFALCPDCRRARYRKFLKRAETGCWRVWRSLAAFPPDPVDCETPNYSPPILSADLNTTPSFN